MHEDQPLLLAVLAQVAHAKPHRRVMHVADPNRLAADQQLAASKLGVASVASMLVWKLSLPSRAAVHPHGICYPFFEP